MTQFEFYSKLVGNTFIEGGQQALRSVTPLQVLRLVREPENEYDTNAVAVYNETQRLGYLPRDTAAKLAKDVDTNNVQCWAQELTGGSEGKDNIGCNLRLVVTRDETIPQEKNPADIFNN